MSSQKKESTKMAQEVAELEMERIELFKELCGLGDFRPGSITPMTRRCGKPTCHCSKRGDPGHGPTIRVTYKINGKSRSESLANAAAVKKTEREIAEYRRFQELCQRLVEVNWRICLLRETEESQGSQVEGKKNDGRRSSKKSGKK
jgi:hypothetical protein